MLNDFTFVFHLKTESMQKAFLLRLFRVSQCRVLVGTGIRSFPSPPLAKIELKNDSSHRLVCCSLFRHIAMAYWLLFIDFSFSLEITTGTQRINTLFIKDSQRDICVLWGKKSTISSAWEQKCLEWDKNQVNVSGHFSFEHHNFFSQNLWYIYYKRKIVSSALHRTQLNKSICKGLLHHF